MRLISSSLLLLSSIFSVSLCDTVLIGSASELIELSNNVNKGIDYVGTTVLLVADIDFSELSSKFNPIGYSASTMLHGIFDGQGHTISNLAVSSSAQYVGLLGCSNNITIRNVVIDDTCSFISSYSSGVPFIGSIIGYSSASKGPCVTANVVNMASVSFGRTSTSNICLGGISGATASSDYSATIKNCVNYGSVIDSGTCSGSDSWAELGGIVGITQGGTVHNYIQNCMNYGTITHSGTSSNLAIGGVAGVSMYSSIDNCVSLGTISTNQESGNIGAVVGRISKSINEVTHCYWADDIGYGGIGCVASAAILSDNSAFSATSFELSESVTIGTSTTTSLINALNAAADHYTLREYSHWLLNKGSHTVSFTVDNAKLSVTLSSQIILLPSLAGRGTTVFRGWYTDNSCTSLLADYDYSEESDLSLYGKFEEDSSSHTITFDTRGGTSVSPITGQLGSVVTLPTDSTREHCEIFKWENEYGDDVPNEFTIPGQDVTLYAVWLCTHITSASDFISFSNIVNSGTDFSGTTVFLDADIDFDGKYSNMFIPVGTSTDKYFLGTFDGQGHTISNLALKSFSLYTGLFGYSHGTTIQNVVIDNTCSFASSYSSGYGSYVGSILGICKYLSGTEYGQCTISNIVNMASMVFDGNVDQDAYVGGIVGYLYSYGYSNYIRNCVNYGTVTHSGSCGGTNADSTEFAYLGGVVGSGEGSSSYNYIQNCANYGSIIHNGTSPNLAIGGIAGYSTYSSISNCVSSGAMSTNKESNYIGAVVGYIKSSTTINYCYWTSDVGRPNIYGYSEIAISTSSNSLTSLNQTTVNKLNEYAAEQGNTWSKWFVVHLNGGSINNITQESLVEIQGHFPDPVKEGDTLLFWCKDAGCNEVFDPKTDSVSGITDIYAEWINNNYIVTFDFDNGTTVNKTFSYGSSIAYPVISEREGYTSNGWDNYHEYMPAKNITITAQWTPNNYAVSFDFGNGTTVNETFSYGSSIEYPKNLIKEGYTFNGWVNYHEYMPAKNITITAQWTEKTTSKAVEIVFSTKELGSDDIEEIIKRYTIEKFTIENVASDPETGGTRVIIKFTDEEKAADFVRTVNENKEPGSFIKRITIIPETVDFSPTQTLSSFFFYFILFFL